VNLSREDCGTGPLVGSDAQLAEVGQGDLVLARGQPVSHYMHEYKSLMCSGYDL